MAAKGTVALLSLALFWMCEDDMSVPLLSGHLAEQSPMVGETSFLQEPKQLVSHFTALTIATHGVDVAQVSFFRGRCTGNMCDVPAPLGRKPSTGRNRVNGCTILCTVLTSVIVNTGASTQPVTGTGSSRWKLE